MFTTSQNFHLVCALFSKVWDEITYPFPNFNNATIWVRVWICNSIPHFCMRVHNGMVICPWGHNGCAHGHDKGSWNLADAITSDQWAYSLQIKFFWTTLSCRRATSWSFAYWGLMGMISALGNLFTRRGTLQWSAFFICHCLGLGLETMIYAVCLCSYVLLSWMEINEGYIFIFKIICNILQTTYQIFPHLCEILIA